MTDRAASNTKCAGTCSETAQLSPAQLNNCEHVWRVEHIPFLSYIASFNDHSDRVHSAQSSVVCWQSNMLGQEVTQPVRWPLFYHRPANAVVQSFWTGHHFRTIQMIVENVYVWLVGPRHPVSERWGRWLEIFLLTYLLTYLLILLNITILRWTSVLSTNPAMVI